MDTIRKITDYLTLQKPQALIELYGSEQSVIDEQKLRYQTLLTRFTHHFPGKNVQIFSSPGRTEIGGNHTDHNHGRVLAGAINLDTIAMAAANDTPTIHIKSTGYPDIILDTTKLDSNPAEQFASISLVRGICSRIKQLGYHIGGFDACIDGKIPRGSGLSSSASFEVLIATIINHLFNKGEIDAMQCALISQYAENTYFGKPCGLMDQITCSVGGLITIDFQDPKHPVVKKINFNFQSTDFHLVITDTGGSHADLNEEYTSIPLEMKSVANAL